MTAGTHTAPAPHPPWLTRDVVQNRLLLDQLIGVGVATPDGTHEPDTDGVNVLT